MINFKNLQSVLSSDIISSPLTHRLIIAAIIVILQIILIWLVVFFFNWLKNKITDLIKKYSPTVSFKKIRIMEAAQLPGAIYFIIKIVKWLVIAILLFLTIPLVLSLFQPTAHLAHSLLGYILAPVHKVFFGFIHYIPNLITIIVFITVCKYLIRSLKFFSDRIEKQKLVIQGFYPDWAQPTFNILRVLIYAFTVAIVYPYLPGADSKIFQGVSVFVGIIISFSSGPAIGNLVAGLVLTYMRPFKLGDRIQIQNVTGFVVEKSPVIIRLRTHKNEYVTFPNSIVLTSSIINYHTSSTEQGLILNAEVSFCYAIAWQKVHEILINAALETNYILDEPKPFVLQTALEDFYARYQINAYTKTVDLVPAIYSQLFENIQNGFKEAGLDMTAAHFRINMVENIIKS